MANALNYAKQLTSDFQVDIYIAKKGYTSSTNRPAIKNVPFIESITAYRALNGIITFGMRFR